TDSFCYKLTAFMGFRNSGLIPFLGIRPAAFSAFAYDDYAYTLKGAITYGIFSSAGTWRRDSRNTGGT
ncbi:hypothetical protein, partial [Paenibacillus sp. 3LSP]|uniref:hypothetical protein n=1 Tax=Paenibacillus sp. 3LSP TaxID=2800795 RepID=UPI002905E51F